MRSPVRPLPPNVGRWASRARWLRWLDALGAWLLAWAVLALAQRTAPPAATAIVAAVLVGLAALIGPLRRRWRPLVAPVIVTARRGLRLVVAGPDQGAEGMEVRRTRVLVVPPAG